MKNTLNIKRIGLIVLAASGMLLANVHANAVDDRNKTVNQQHLSKRPYQQAPEVSATEQQDKWEGATLIKDEDRAGKLPTKHQQMRINMLGRQPYAEKAGE